VPDERVDEADEERDQHESNCTGGDEDEIRHNPVLPRTHRHFAVVYAISTPLGVIYTRS
jgi:hypothetical protein